MDASRPHPTERVVVDHWDEEIDVEIAPLIRSLWEAGIETVMSCQDTGDGWVWIEFADLEGLEEFVSTIIQMTTKSSLIEKISWESEDSDSWWMYELFPWLHRLDEQQENAAGGLGPIAKVFLNPSLRFPNCDIHEVTALMALSNSRTASVYRC